MEFIEENISFQHWIKKNTKGSKSVVELGAGFFWRLNDVSSDVQTKIGIEIHQPYIDRAQCGNSCIKIQGDILNYRNLLQGYVLDCVMLIDILEHLDMETGFNLINNLKEDFNKIILMLPDGKYEQDTDVYGLGGDEYQTHRSYWYDEDVEKLGFTENIVYRLMHTEDNRIERGLPTGCYFCIWEKIKN